MKCNEQAKRIYKLCVSRANSQNTLTYGELLKSLGYQQGVSGQTIRYGLELVLIACGKMSLTIKNGQISMRLIGNTYGLIASGSQTNTGLRDTGEVNEHSVLF